MTFLLPLIGHLTFGLLTSSELDSYHWTEPRLQAFGEFFFVYENGVPVETRVVGILPQERLGALKKLSLENNLKEYLEEKYADWWRMALARLLSLEVILKLSATLSLSLWELRERYSDHLGSSPPPSHRKRSLLTLVCRKQLRELSASDSGHGKGRRRGSIARIGVASGLGLWTLADLYGAATYRGRDLEVEWLAEREKEPEWQKNLGDQLSSLQTSGLFEEIKAHLHARGISDQYLAKVIAPLSSDEIWKGYASKAHVIIEPQMKNAVSFTIELAWDQSGGWIFTRSFFGTPQASADDEPFDVSMLRK